jgi:hypothetical protein
MSNDENKKKLKKKPKKYWNQIRLIFKTHNSGHETSLSHNRQTRKNHKEKLSFIKKLNSDKKMRTKLDKKNKWNKISRDEIEKKINFKNH